METEEGVAREVRLRVLSRTEPLVLCLAIPATVLFAVKELFGGRRDAVPFVVLQLIAGLAILVARRFGIQARGFVITAYAVSFGTLGALIYGPLLGTGVIFTLAIVASVGLIGRRAALPAVGVVLAAYVIVATVKLTGLGPVTRGASVDFDTTAPWLRIGLTLAVGATIAGLLTSYVFRSLELAVIRSGEALARERTERLERERAQEALARAQRLEAVGRLAAGVAHDLNNALAVVVCSAESLRELPAGDAAREQLLNDLLEAARGAEETTRQLTMLGRKDTVAREHCQPAVVAEQLARSINRLLPPGITVVVEASSAWTVPLSRSRFEQVLLNLALNARDAMPTGGTLRIAVREVGEDIHLVVTDTGVGIDETARQQLFEPFFTTKEAGRGSGLGLSLVHAMVTEAGGTIDVTSKLGEGTTFTVTLPRVLEPAPSGPLTDAPKTARAPERRTARILLVEDEPSMLRAITRVLRAAGHHVIAAADGSEADAELARGESLDLLLTDAVIPGTDTAAMIDRFLLAHPAKPVLVCSGFVKAEVVRQGIAAGRFHFLQKPFRPAEINAAVEAALATAR